MTHCLHDYLSGKSSVWLMKYWKSLHEKACECCSDSAADYLGKYISLLFVRKVKDEISDLQFRHFIEECRDFVQTSMIAIRSLNTPSMDFEFEIDRVAIGLGLITNNLDIPVLELEEKGTLAILKWNTTIDGYVLIKMTSASAYLEIVNGENTTETFLDYPVDISKIKKFFDATIP